MIKTTLAEMQTKKVTIELTQLELLMAFLNTGIGIGTDGNIEDSITEEERQALYNLADAIESFADVQGEDEDSDALVIQASKNALNQMGLRLLGVLTTQQ